MLESTKILVATRIYKGDKHEIRERREESNLGRGGDSQLVDGVGNEDSKCAGRVARQCIGLFGVGRRLRICWRHDKRGQNSIRRNSK